MEDSRREFLKKAGIGSLVGLGVAAAATSVVQKTGVAASQGHGAATASGTRWGMIVDTRKLIDGVEICTKACHEAHNVPDHRLPDGSPDKKNEVKWIWKEPYHNAFPSKSTQFVNKELKDREVYVLCNHCEDPPCVRVCPTQATFKRDDGIVTMDFHRCIGCRFCMAACPYGSRSFNWKDPREKGSVKVIGRQGEPNREFPTRERGVVEKCNFCVERLAKGLQPACVEAHPEAIIFGDLNDPNSEISQALKSNHTIQRKPELGTGPSVFYIV